MAFPPQELSWFCRLESIDIWFSLRDHSEGLPYQFVGDRNDRHFTWLTVRPETVETGLTFSITSERGECRHIKLASKAWISVAVDVTFDVYRRTR